MWKYARWLSRQLNWILQGDNNEMISSRCYHRNWQVFTCPIDWFFYIVWNQTNHCKEAWESENAPTQDEDARSETATHYL